MTDADRHALKAQAVHAAMPPALKAVAAEARQLARLEARGVLLLRHDLGVRLRRVRAEEARYTSRGIDSLARYLGVGPGRLLDLIAVVEAFDREQVEAMAGRLMSNGGRVTHEHLVAVARAPRADRAGLVEAVFGGSLTVRQLLRLIREREAARRAALRAKRADPVGGNGGGPG